MRLLFNNYPTLITNNLNKGNIKMNNDHSIFRRTAARTKACNVKPIIMRGGTRF